MKTKLGLKAAYQQLLIISLCFFAGFVKAQPAPDEMGNYAVGHISSTLVDSKRDNRTIPLDIWYPSTAPLISSPALYNIPVPTNADLANLQSQNHIYSFEQVNAVVSANNQLYPAYENVIAAKGTRFPLVIISHGNDSTGFLMNHIATALASHGFIVAAPTHTGSSLIDDSVDLDHALINYAQDIPFVIDFMLSNNKTGSKTTNPLFNRLNPNKIAVVGHSLGGFAALAQGSGYISTQLHVSTAPDKRVKAIVPIEASARYLSARELAHIRVPALFIGKADAQYGNEDGNGNSAWTQLKGLPRYRVDVIDSNHNSFFSTCFYTDFLIPLLPW